MSKIRRVRGAGNTDTLRWAESLSEHEAILTALKDPPHEDLPRILQTHSENTAREVMAVLGRTRHSAASDEIPQVAASS